MTTELRTIQIEAYRDPDGRPVCAGEKTCLFLSVGRVHCVCLIARKEVDRVGVVSLRPVEGCPVWGDK